MLRRHRERGNIKELPDAVSLDLVDGKQVICRFLGRLDGNKLPFVAVEMGVPKLDEAVSFFSGGLKEVDRVSAEIGLPKLKQSFGLVDISNNHLVFFMDEVNRELIRKIGPAFQVSSLWDGINVHIVATKEVQNSDRSQARDILGKPIEDLFKVFIWERGAAETQACGSGASAIGALVFDEGLVPRSEWIGIDMPGGRLYISQKAADEPVVMAGPGEFVFAGRVEI